MANAWIFNPHTLATATASATTTGAAANLTNDFLGMIWAADGATMSGAGPFQQSIVADVGRDVTVDTILLLGLTDDAPAGSTFRISAATAAQGVGFNGRWISASAPLYAGEASLPNSDQALLWAAPASGGPPAARYWEIVITTPARWTVRARRVLLGRRLDLARNFGFGAAFGFRDLGSYDFSSRGVPLRRRSKILRGISLTFSYVTKVEAEYQMNRLLNFVGNTRPIALITDPAVDEMRTNRIFYGPLVGDLGSIWRRASAFQAQISVTSLF